jgi:hypothetical protein
MKTAIFLLSTIACNSFFIFWYVVGINLQLKILNKKLKDGFILSIPKNEVNNEMR